MILGRPVVSWSAMAVAAINFVALVLGIPLDDKLVLGADALGLAVIALIGNESDPRATNLFSRSSS